MVGSRSTSAREPGQVRKEAALSGHRWAVRGRPAGVSEAGSPRRPTSTEGARSTFASRRLRRLGAKNGLTSIRWRSYSRHGLRSFDNVAIAPSTPAPATAEWAATYEDTVKDAMDLDLLDVIDVEWGGTVVDLGCGTGRTGRVAAPRVDAIDGVDLTPEMLARAAARGVYRSLREGDVTATGLERPVRHRRLLPRRRAPADARAAVRRGRAAGADVRARRLPPALHHGHGDADPLRRRRRRADRDRDPRAPDQRARRGGARRRVRRCATCASG